MADQNLWAQIAEDYKQARANLCGSKDAMNWHMDEDTGMYYLYCAYQAARTSTEKDHLLYARILSLMEWNQGNLNDYTRLHRFIAPALAEYELAIQSGGQQPYEKELENIRQRFNALTYICEQEVACGESLERALSLIEGSELLSDFGFHDSKPILFQHTEQTAILKLDCDGVVATIEFTGLYDVEVNGDPVTNWIDEMYCYRSYWIKDRLIFDIGYYKIECEHIKVIRVEQKKKTNENAGRVTINALHEKLLGNTKPAGPARTSDPRIFNESIFSAAFGTAAIESYRESQDRCPALLSKYNAVMSAPAGVICREMRQTAAAEQGGADCRAANKAFS